ncbi:MAG: bifunctional RNase H/acid phosphatase [Jatrophihabitans sp.]|uniref:bifunctional RNase H/acid phosphatase n=1 Tax=Jatrophihabitans sp. TaxID=1932789 RepID=UPI003F7E710D
MERVVVEADGGSRGNPGPAGYGAVVLDADTEAVLAERDGFLGVVSNNVAEYRGLIAGLEAAAELGASSGSVRMDSKLVIEQMSGRWQVKHPAMKPLHAEARELVRRFADVRFQWIPRERNTRADRLANRAMDAGQGSTPAAAPSAAAPAVAAPAVTAPAPASGGSWVPPTDSATRLVLVRHGATPHSAAKRFSGRNDLALDETGTAQASALARRFASIPDIAAVISSPLRRTVETATAIADAVGLTVATDDGLIETDFGDWEGLTFAEARERDADALTAWLASPDAAPPGGESFAAVTDRVAAARDRIVAAHPGRTLIVVSHVTPIKTLVRLALEAPPVALYRLHLDTASVSMIDWFADGNCSVRLVNDVSHLYR